jgi:quercetin dioxygenase-like cupin family protein
MPVTAIMMSPSPPSSPSAVPSLAGSHVFRAYRAGRVLWVLGTRVRFLIDGADTGGRFSMQEMYTPAVDPGPPPHSHADADEMFHVLDGALKVMVAGEFAVARAGDTLLVPRNTLHTFSNPYLTPCRFLVQLSPAGFEGFFADVGIAPASADDLFTPPTVAPPQPEQLRALAIKHRMHVPGLTD